MKILLIAGGWSSEREVALTGAKGMESALKNLGHEVRFCDLLTDFDNLIALAERHDFAMLNLHGTPGEILTDGKKYLAIATADSAVGLLDVQLQGKKRMDVKAFLAGWRDASSWKTTQGTSKAEIAQVKALESES